MLCIKTSFNDILTIFVLFQVKFLWLEDMYVTGALAEGVGLTYMYISNSLHHGIKYNKEKTKAVKEKRIYLLGHVPSVDDVYNYWKNVQIFTALES